MIVKNVVAFPNDKDGIPVVCFDEKRFSELIVMNDGTGFGIVFIQTVIRLYPEVTIAGINNFVDNISQQEIFIVHRLIRDNIPAVVDIQTVASADHHQAVFVLTKIGNRTVGQVIVVGDLFQVIGK
jgi:hypothetical protein